MPHRAQCASPQHVPVLIHFCACRVREHIIDGMCCLAQSLEGMIPELVARVNSGGHVLTKELATFLTQAKETAWTQVLPFLVQKAPPPPPLTDSSSSSFRVR